MTYRGDKMISMTEIKLVVNGMFEDSEKDVTHAQCIQYYPYLIEMIETYERILYGYSLRKQGGIAGQAFTTFQCIRCKKEDTHCNTNTPLFCDQCSKEIKSQIKSHV